MIKLFLSIYSELNKNEKRKFNIIFLFTLLLLCLELFSLVLILPIITLIINDNFYLQFSQFSIFEEWSKNQQILFCLVLLIIIFFIKNFFSAFMLFYKKKFLADIQIDFTSRIYKSYMSQSYSFYLKSDKSNIIRNLGIVGEYINVIDNFFNAFLELLILVGILLIIFFKDSLAGIFISLLSIIFIIFTFSFLKKRLKKYGELANLLTEKLIDSYLNTFSSIRDIILQKKQNFFLSEFRKNLSKQAITNVKNSFFTELPRLVIEVLLILCISIIVYFLFSKSNNITDTLVTLTFITALIFRAIPSVSRITSQLSGLTFKIDIINKVNQLISNFSDEKNIEVKKIDLKFEELELMAVKFGYDDSNLVFKNINLNIKKNETIGIIGSSGSGKSTLIDIVTGMLKPNFGKIALNQKNLDKNLIYEWQSKISCISQKNYLLNSTLKNNVAFGENEDEINYSKVEECLKLSQIYYLASENKEGLNFLIEEDGKNLSGGQRQRIILARALYRQSEVLIFDEATSALDEKTEKEIMYDIKKNFHGKKTIIISTHKHNLLDFCDKIYNVEKF